MTEGSLWLLEPHDSPWSDRTWPTPKVFLLASAVVSVWVQLPWKVWYFCWDLEQKNFFIISYVLLLIQTLYGDSLDLGQLKRKDILPLKRSPKITTQFIPVYLLDAEHCCQEDVNMLDYYLLFEDSVILPGVCIVTTKNISLVAQPHQLCCISIPACGVEVLSWGHVYFWAGLGSTLLTYDMMQN